MKEQLRSEAKQLPLILGKLVGGIISVIGFGGAVIVLTRRPGPTWGGAAGWLLAGIIGLALFVVSSRVLARRAAAEGSKPSVKERARTSVLSFAILLILAAVFIVIVLMLAA